MFHRNRKKQLKNKVLFNKLILKVKGFEENKEQTKQKFTIDKTELLVERKPKTVADSAYVIDDEKVIEILLKIKKLENQKYFLRQGCSLHSMAKKLKTNTSYLSKIVNTHLNKTFSAYLNELRVNYAIIELKRNKQLRAYSTKAIAQELGYKKAASFTKYFKETTGITPAVYIKKIKNLS